MHHQPEHYSAISQATNQKTAVRNWKKWGRFPHELTQAQMSKPKIIAQKLLLRHPRSPFLAKVIAVNESNFFSKVNVVRINGCHQLSEELQLHVRIDSRQKSRHHPAGLARADSLRLAASRRQSTPSATLSVDRSNQALHVDVATI
ncbi:hypothetical protein KIN20_038115 [Parelaphostrongylus tenuis]|uniref:Uncharacterized protein n=1 Tax=Parelaphostrongylus tenuis TaxID=148309 RepID=A0AAD5WLD2_PARTN|nr:hypothetical protein KIN20_038115 [Parelaphostrongylus tenuis]